VEVHRDAKLAEIKADSKARFNELGESSIVTGLTHQIPVHATGKAEG